MLNVGGKKKVALGSLLAAISLLIFVHICKYAMGDDIWYDEVFSLSFARHSFGDIVRLTSRDVHPPLYYFYLKIVTSLICAVCGSESFIIASKIASLIPWIGLFVLGITYIRKKFGYLAFGLYVLLILAMPQIPTYYVEIRMYSLALFFITSEILLTHHILTNSGKRATVSWILFFFLGILTAYTQYYACIAVIGNYLAMFLIALFTKNPDKKSLLKNTILCSLFSVILYIPWLPKLKSQMDAISGTYWIQPLTLRSLAGCVKFAVLPVVYMGNMPVISAGLTLLAVFILFIMFIRKRQREDVISIICCFCPIFTVVLSGFILSALGTPIFIYRYLIPALGGVWLLVGIMAEKTIQKPFFLVLLVPFLLACFLNIKGLDAEEGNKLVQIDRAMEAVETIPENSVIITNFDHVASIMAFYRQDCDIILYESPIDKLLPDMFGNITDMVSDEQILMLTKDNNQSVYFLGSFNSREEIVEAWKTLGINSTMTDNVLIERYWLNIYKLEVADNG